MENKKKEYYTIDLGHIFKTLWKRVWVIIVVGVLVAVLGLVISSFVIKPTYSSSVMLYVNNSSINIGGNVFNMSEITAAQSLVKTYREILLARDTLELIIDETGVPYTYKELAGMITAESVNETEIMRVTVVSTDPYEAQAIAACISDVLPERIIQIIDGATMAVVDDAVVNPEKIAPSRTTYTIAGFALGALVATIVLIVIAMMDDTIHDEEYVLNNYEYPILAKIPDLINAGGKKYGYYQNKYKVYK